MTLFVFCFLFLLETDSEIDSICLNIEIIDNAE